MKKENFKEFETHLKICGFPISQPYSRHIIMRAKVELLLLSDLKKVFRRRWLPGKCEKGEIKIRNESFILQLDAQAEEINMVQKTDIPLPWWFLFGKDTPRLVNLPEMKNAAHVLVRLFSIANPIRIWNDPKQKMFSTGKPEQEQIDILEGFDAISTEQLAYGLGISENGVCGDLNLSETSIVQPYFAQARFKDEDEHYLFRKSENVICYSVVRKKLNGHHVMLPESAFIYGDNTSEFTMNVMPSRKDGQLYPLYNLDLLSIFPKTDVCLTDILEIAVYSRSSERLLFSSFYGGREAVPYTDVRPLFGNKRKTCWLLVDHPDAVDKKEKYRVALAMMERFQAYDRQLCFLKPCRLKWSSLKKENPNGLLTADWKDMVTLSPHDFLKECKTEEVDIPSNLRFDEVELLDGEEADRVSEDKALISPILPHGTFGVIYADQKAGKSFAALGLSIALANGEDPFPGHWTNADGKVRKVLYVSGEMSKAIFKKRKCRFEKFLCHNPENKHNIIFCHASGRTITEPDDQKLFDRAIIAAQYDKGIPGQKVDLIVFDNWNALVPQGVASSGRFNAFYKWISKHMDEGIAVLLINHTTKSKTILGSGAMANLAHIKIRIYKMGQGDIRMLIVTENIRDGSQSLFAPFTIELDFDANTPWKIEKPSSSDVARIIRNSQPGKSSEEEGDDEEDCEEGE